MFPSARDSLRGARATLRVTLRVRAEKTLRKLASTRLSCRVASPLEIGTRSLRGPDVSPFLFECSYSSNTWKRTNKFFVERNATIDSRRVVDRTVERLFDSNLIPVQRIQSGLVKNTIQGYRWYPSWPSAIPVRVFLFTFSSFSYRGVTPKIPILFSEGHRGSP